MQSTSEGCLNIADLANQLRREKIFISSERQILQNLNEEVDKTNVELLQAAWVCSQQRQNLTDLITSRCEADSIAACQRASALEETTFIDAHKVFKFKEATALAELFGWLRESPHLVALCLLLGEDDMPPSLPSSLVAGLYGSCRLSEDRTQFLAVIRSLIKHHLAIAPDPRKLFRSSKSALPLLYSVFKDGHTPARQFLVAALSGPVMNVLQEDEFFLDIDPDKAMERFNQTDRQKKFGQANSPEYAAKASRYRKWTIQSLYNLTNQFIISLREHWNCFPTSIAWIVQQIVLLLKQHSRISERELHSLCTELVLSNFICPAIVNPEAHGVVELPVSYIARSNLVQIAQILQVLCLAHTHEVEPKLRDLYSKFDRTCVSSLLHALTTAPQVRKSSLERTAVPTEPAQCHNPRAMFQKDQLLLTINFLKRISSKLNNNTPSVTAEEAYKNSSAAVAAEASAYCETASDGSSSSSEGNAANLTALLQSIEPNYRSRLHDLLKKMPDLTQITICPTNQIDKASPEHSIKKGILAAVGRPRLPRSGSSNAALAVAPSDDAANPEDVEKVEPPRVIVISLPNKEDHDYVGLLPESKVLECYYGGAEAADGVDTALAVPGAPPVQKRTRFSVSHDEVSLGNTSDMLEAVSEAASNHSVTSSLELETEDQNDNLSDMVSANVSGRGSPNISGRETPSSQVTDGDAPGDGAVRRIPQNVPVSQQASNNAQKLLKQTRNEIEDKFCKFEIRKLLEGDETISIMSDTWSTDVLASDSETIGDAEQTQIQANTGTNSSNTIAPDVSETASESAWSMDVLASDSDRNTEVDTDDCVSVAARSDTSWPRRPSQQDEPSSALQNLKKPDTSSPRHTARPLPNRSGGGYLCATAQLTRGAELDLMSHGSAQAHYTLIDNRKSILVNGYPVMTCNFPASAPDSPGTAQAPPLPNDVFEYEPPANNYQAETESTLEDGNSDATSQWVDDSFPSGSDERYKNNGANKRYEQDDNSSESSFNALRVEHYASRFDSNIEAERQPQHTTDARSTITELMSRMSSATISSAALVNNVTQRIVKSEIRTSVVSISSSRLDKKNQPSASNHMSQSSMSVNSAGTSVSDRSSSQDVNSDNPTERRVSPPPQPTTSQFKASTGAIPKSISFDATAEKSQRRRSGEEGLASNLDDLKNNVKRSGGNLFNKIKMFRQKGRSHTHTNGAEIKLAVEEHESPASRLETAESSEDILAKYRRKSSSDSGRGRRGSTRMEPHIELERAEGVLDLNDPEAFNSMKRKLRTVLSNADLYSVENVPNSVVLGSLVEWVAWGAALSGSEAAAAAGGEAARLLLAATAAATSCPSEGGGALAGRLAAALRQDLAARRPYAAYLAACRANLAITHMHLRRQVQQIRAEGVTNARAAAAARVLDQLERGSSLRRLYTKLSRKDRASLTDGELIDERASRLTASIKAITAEVKADPSWDGASPTVLEMVEITVERAVYARLYLHVMFPNGDGDIARDQVVAEHIRRLGGSRPRAPRAPCPPPYARALAHLRRLAVARTPRDKIACIMKCVQCIMAALALNEGAEPSADDLMPVLVYVVIRVNPPSLLSTIELVNALGAASLTGEALYWWTQFCAAVAYIKTMDYTS